MMPDTLPNPPGDQLLQTNRFQSRTQPTPHTQDVNLIWLTISNESKKKFHKLTDQLTLLARTKALIKFLQNCVKNKQIPKTFQIKHTIDLRFSDAGRSKLNNSIKSLQLTHLKLSISEHQKREKSLNDNYLRAKNEFCLCLETTEINIINKELELRFTKLLNCEENKYKAKSLKLQIEKKKNTPPPQDTPPISEKSSNKRRWVKRSIYRRRQRKLSRKPLQNLVINYSDHVLTKDQSQLLNKHISFVPIPDKINFTQLTYDFERFERSMRWKEFHSNKDPSENDSNKEECIFPSKKSNLPNVQPSRALNNFLYGVKSDLFNVQKNKIYPNISPSEKSALNELIKLQKSGKIVIQRSDKGGAITIMNREDYINSVQVDHLSSKITKEDGTILPVYRQIDPVMVKVHYNLIKDEVEAARNSGKISQKVADQLLPDQPSEARAYAMPKAHKDIPEGKKLPPTRLVISGCGSNTENISHFVNHHTKHIPECLDSFIQDTPHLLRTLEERNKGPDIPSNGILVSIDVVGLYPNIPQDEGMLAFKEAINDPKYDKGIVPTSFLMTLLQFVLTYNTFIFNSLYYIQEWGTAIGTKLAPVYANIFMGKLESMILKDFKGRPPDLWRRYIDDIICLFCGSEEELLSFLEHISSFHSTIKFTCEYRLKDVIVKTKWKNNKLCVTRSPLNNIRPRSIDFLDCNIWINENNKFETDLFVKSSDRITYLKPSSCHPKHICRNIPYSLAYRLKRICSSIVNFEIRLKELESNLISRGYVKKVIKNAFDKLKNISREQALKKVVSSKNDKDNVLFAHTYDPRIVPISDSIKKHFVIAQKEASFKNSFPKMPMVGYRRARNLGEHLIRAKLYPNQRYELRNRNGFFVCDKRNNGCSLCNRSNSIVEHVASHSNKKYPVKSKIKCSDTYVIYSIQCKICPKQYVGQTSNTAAKRFNSHFYDVIHKLNKPVARHFNSRNHSASDMVLTPFEKLHVKDRTLLNVRERYWIIEKETATHGLNINV